MARLAPPQLFAFCDAVASLIASASFSNKTTSLDMSATFRRKMGSTPSICFRSLSVASTSLRKDRISSGDLSAMTARPKRDQTVLVTEASSKCGTRPARHCVSDTNSSENIGCNATPLYVHKGVYALSILSSIPGMIPRVGHSESSRW